MAPTREEMVSVTPEHNLYDVCKTLRDNRLHRLPVLDPTQNSVLSVITHSGILEYLVATFREQRRLFDQPIFDLGIGVYSGFVTVPEDMPLIRVLHTLIERRVSAVPIVDPSGTYGCGQALEKGVVLTLRCVCVAGSRRCCEYLLCIERHRIGEGPITYPVRHACGGDSQDPSG
jgi:CBS domain-containing protein